MITNEFSFRRQWGPSPKYIRVLNYKHPGDSFVVISGPCSVEDTNQIKTISKFVALHGATHLRGGVFRAGTYPGKSFGYIETGLIRDFHTAAKDNGLKNIIEILDYNQSSLDIIAKYSDCIQVGCRQMQNYTLLRMLGIYDKPVLLKRHPGTTIDEWLGAAEHLLEGGVKEVYLIERGSSTNATHVRWQLDLTMIPAVQSITNIPIICDASHGTGRRDLVSPMTLAGVAAGANGILIEVHEYPDESISDKDQAIGFNEYESLMDKVRKIKEAKR